MRWTMGCSEAEERCFSAAWPRSCLTCLLSDEQQGVPMFASKRLDFRISGRFYCGTGSEVERLVDP